PGKPVTLHVLLPRGTEVLEARFYPELYPVEGIDLDRPDVKWEKVEPVSRSEVTWNVLGWTWRWTQLDFRMTPKYDERRRGCSALVLKLRIQTAHREPEEIDRLPIAGPKHYSGELGSYYHFGCIEWPVPLQPSGREGGFNCWATSDAWGPHVLFLWPGGFADIREGFTNVSLTDHLVLTLGGGGGGSGAAVDVVGVDWEERERVVQSEWPQVTERFGFPYVPVVAVIGLEKKEPSSPKTGRKPEREKPAKHELPVPPVVPPPMRDRRRLTGKASNSSP
ncbi:hypothetical protein, partial [Methanopyrus kandleri]